MKKTLLTILTVCMVAILGQAQIETPQPSPAGSVYTKVGLTDVTIDYFRPKMRGRQIFGEGADYLQPYGTLWRAGANSGTKLTLSTDVKIAGQDVKAGEYLIFLTPGKDEFKFMLYSDLSIGGNVGNYDKANEVMMATAPVTALSTPVEALTYQITDLTADNTGASIQMNWENVSVKVPMTVSFDDIVMAEIKAKTQVNPGNYVAAANYYFTTGKDLNQALEWINQYLAVGGNSNQFWNVHLKAQILAKLGKKKEAIATAEESMAKAKANPSGDFGYVKRNEDLIKSLK